jgi:hypothetical protein
MTHRSSALLSVLPWVPLLLFSPANAQELETSGTCPSVPVSIDADEVHGMAFLVGDAGDEIPGTSPLLCFLKEDVRAWSTWAEGEVPEAERDSVNRRVYAVFLGDNIYEEGLHTDPERRPDDVLRLEAQLEALEHLDASVGEGIFILGNHDWANDRGRKGARHALNQHEYLNERALAGVNVSLLPDATLPGPVHRDMGDRARLVFIDSTWWLMDPDSAARSAPSSAIGSLVASAGPRQTVLMAHHPLVSGGPHGGNRSWFAGLARAMQLLVQDTNSGPYRRYISDVRGALSEGTRSVVIASGHDHSLQVITDSSGVRPIHHMVSGSASKIQPVRAIPGTVWQAADHGYMRLVFLNDGRMRVDVVTSGIEACEGVCQADQLGAVRLETSLILNP